MALRQSITRINPLDLNKNVTIGVAFPIDEVNLFNGTQTMKEQVKSNLINLLLTDPGERVFEPNFGVGLKKFLFEPHMNTINLEEVIQEQVNIYIPEIQIEGVRANFSPDEHILYLKIIYRFLLDGSNDSIQLNFNN